MIGKREEGSIWSLLSLLASKEVLPRGNDVIVWPLDRKGSFSVKSFCSTQVEATRCWDGAAKAIWNPKVPTKAFFCLGSF